VNPETSGEFITLARVVKTQGRWGEVAAEVHSDVAGRFSVGMRLRALAPGVEKNSGKAASAGKVSAGLRRELHVRELHIRELQIEDLWPHKGLLVLKFAGVDSISQAEELLRCELQVAGSERAQLEPGWNYVSDLVGCSVLDHGREIGRIEDVQFGAGEAPLLIVADHAGQKLDVPFAEAFLDAVDAAHRQVRMKLPEGLLQVNAPLTAEEKREQQAHPAKRKRVDKTGRMANLRLRTEN
jgi:16S rRNA processing protein RimM